jgi:hypothetical protein
MWIPRQYSLGYQMIQSNIASVSEAMHDRLDKIVDIFSRLVN